MNSRLELRGQPFERLRGLIRGSPSSNAQREEIVPEARWRTPAEGAATTPLSPCRHEEFKPSSLALATARRAWHSLANCAIPQLTMILIGAYDPNWARVRCCRVTMYICICHAVTDRSIREVVNRGARSLSDVQCELPVGSCCGRCQETAEKVVEECLRARSKNVAEQLEPLEA